MGLHTKTFQPFAKQNCPAAKALETMTRGGKLRDGTLMFLPDADRPFYL